jgi:hypothetical protein
METTEIIRTQFAIFGAFFPRFSWSQTHINHKMRFLKDYTNILIQKVILQVILPRCYHGPILRPRRTCTDVLLQVNPQSCRSSHG